MKELIRAAIDLQKAFNELGSAIGSTLIEIKHFQLLAQEESEKYKKKYRSIFFQNIVRFAIYGFNGPDSIKLAHNRMLATIDRVLKWR